MIQPIEDFEVKLKALIGDPTDLRPFVCDGSPLECRAFIVGFNPAVMLSANFWDFWIPGYGFNKAAWFEAYLGERRTRPLKPGKKFRNPISNTRKVLNWIAEAAAPVRCLETNVYAAATEEASDLPSSRRITAPLEFLLAEIKPGVIVTHGKDAEAFIRNKRFGWRVHVKSVPHFARGWSQERVRELGRWIASMEGFKEP